MPKGDAKEGYLNTNAHLEAKVALLELAIAESQAHEQKLRTALAAAIIEADGWHDECRGEPCAEVDWCRDALATQQDDSALHEIIAAAKAEERESCAMFVERDCADNQMADPRELKEVAAAIRARITST